MQYKSITTIATHTKTNISGRLNTKEITKPTRTVTIATNKSFWKDGAMILAYGFPNVCKVNIRFLLELAHNCASIIPEKIIDIRIRTQAVI